MSVSPSPSPSPPPSSVPVSTPSRVIQHTAQPLADISSNEYANRIQIAANHVAQQCGRAEMAIVLGSGLMGFTSTLSNTRSLRYDQVPYMPGTTVSGHDGRLVWGHIKTATGEQPVLCFAGRVHAYEGWRPHEIGFIARLCSALGVRLFLLTNSAGGCLAGMTPGSIMLIDDHIRMCSVNPVIDVCDDPRYGMRHIDHHMYSTRVAELAKEAAKKLGITLHQGTYCWTSGPTYETPAEVRAGVSMGAGAFGMSTVPEVVMAHAIGMEVFGMSLATNLAAGMDDEKLTHEAVKQVAAEAGPKFQKLLVELFAHLDVSTFPPSRTAVVPVLSLKNEFQPFQWYEPWIPTMTEISAGGASLIAANTSQQSLVAAIISGHSSHDASIVSHLQHQRSLALTDLAPLRARGSLLSPSARHGRLILGTTSSGVRVIVLVHQQLEGLATSEAAYLVQVFASIGIRTLLSTFVATNVAAISEPSHLILVNDTLDRTMERLPEVASSTLGSRTYGSPVFDPTLIQSAHSIISSATIGAYCAYPGPSFPTVAEVNVAKTSGCHAVGITPVTAFTMAKTLGFRIFGLIESVSQFHHLLTSTPQAAVVAKVLNHVVGNGSLVAEPVTVPSNAAKSPSSFIIPYFHHQEHPPHVADAATYIKSKLNVNGLRVAVFVEHMFTAIHKQIKITSSLAATSIPHWHQDHVGYASGAKEAHREWTFAVGTVQDSPLLFLYDTSSSPPDATHRTFDNMGFATRIIHALGIDHLLLATHVTSCADHIQPGSLITFSDHINLSGVNPLFGDNITEWGARFPDMSGAYSSELNQQAQAFSTSRSWSLSTPLQSSVVAHFAQSTSTFDSVAESMFAQHVGASTLIAGTVPVNIVARHSDTSVFSLGFVTSRVPTSTSDAIVAPQFPSPSMITLMGDVLSHLVTHINTISKKKQKIENGAH